MNAATLSKTAREMLVLLIIVVAGVVLLEMLFVAAMREFTSEMQYLWMQKAIFQRFARMLLGADLGDQINATGLMTIGFAHPLLFALNWTLLLTVCTGVIVGEIERGTADLLLTLPVSRGTVYRSVTVVWLAAGIPVSAAVLLGAWIGETLAPMEEPLNYAALGRLAVNLFVLYACIGCAAMCVSSFCSRRGLAIAVVLGWLLGSMLLNFLSQFWSVAERLSAIGLLHYYRPLPVVRDARWPLADMGVLTAIAVVLWSVGLWRYRRRDIPAA